jgi:8-oxo-dGTP pyrophosphatase MutT (NUDIX family)
MAAKFCSECGHRFGEQDQVGIHHHCSNCGRFSGENPRVVNVILVPVYCEDGETRLLAGLRSKPVDPGFNKFGLPAGWQDLGETPRQGAVREAKEEQGIEIEPCSLTLFGMYCGSAKDKVVLCWLAPRVLEVDLPEFVPCIEVSERKLIGPGESLAFPIHSLWATQYFQGQRSIDGNTACTDSSC